MVILLVKGEETIISVDEQGRMVLPSRLREKLGIKKGGKLSIRTESSHALILERKVEDDIEDRVSNWVSLALAERGQIGQLDNTKNPISTKWMSSAYARRKLGL